MSETNLVIFIILFREIKNGSEGQFEWLPAMMFCVSDAEFENAETLLISEVHKLLMYRKKTNENAEEEHELNEVTGGAVVLGESAVVLGGGVREHS